MFLSIDRIYYFNPSSCEEYVKIGISPDNYGRALHFSRTVDLETGLWLANPLQLPEYDYHFFHINSGINWSATSESKHS
jgi:hypothetical protein